MLRAGIAFSGVCVSDLRKSQNYWLEIDVTFGICPMMNARYTWPWHMTLSYFCSFWIPDILIAMNFQTTSFSVLGYIFRIVSRSWLQTSAACRLVLPRSQFCGGSFWSEKRFLKHQYNIVQCCWQGLWM